MINHSQVNTLKITLEIASFSFTHSYNPTTLLGRYHYYPYFPDKQARSITEDGLAQAHTAHK